MKAAAQKELPRLSVVASLFQACRNVFGQPKALLSIAVLPMAVSSAVPMIHYWNPWGDYLLSALHLLLLILPMSYLALAWSRYSLLDRAPRFLVVRPWFAAYVKLLAYYLLWSLIICGLPFAIILGGQLARQLLAGVPLFLPVEIRELFGIYAPITWTILVLAMVLPFGRLFLALPMIAAGLPASPKSAWRLGAGIGLRLGAAVSLLNTVLIAGWMLCLAVSGYVIWTILPEELGIDPRLHDQNELLFHHFPRTLGWSITLIGGTIGTVIFAELLAIAFRKATGWTSDQQSYLERFE